MAKFKRIVTAFLHQDDGVTAIEYALIGALIAVAIVAAVTSVGTNLNALFQNVADQVGNAIAGAF